jgi:hypothetical protein
MADSREKGIVCTAGDMIYSRLAKRAVVAMLISVVFEGMLQQLHTCLLIIMSLCTCACALLLHCNKSLLLQYRNVICERACLS